MKSGRQITEELWRELYRLSQNFEPPLKKMPMLFPIIQAILGVARETKRVGEVEAEVLKKYQKYSPMPQDIKYQMAWLLKQGLLEVVS